MCGRRRRGSRGSYRRSVPLGVGRCYRVVWCYTWVTYYYRRVCLLVLRLRYSMRFSRSGREGHGGYRGRRVVATSGDNGHGGRGRSSTWRSYLGRSLLLLGSTMSSISLVVFLGDLGRLYFVGVQPYRVYRVGFYVDRLPWRGVKGSRFATYTSRRVQVESSYHVRMVIGGVLVGFFQLCFSVYGVLHGFTSASCSLVSTTMIWYGLRVSFVVFLEVLFRAYGAFLGVLVGYQGLSSRPSARFILVYRFGAFFRVASRRFRRAIRLVFKAFPILYKGDVCDRVFGSRLLRVIASYFRVYATLRVSMTSKRSLYLHPTSVAVRGGNGVV